MSESDVAKVREMIELECQALNRVFNDLSGNASHASINARFANLDNHREALEQQIGKEKAVEEVVKTYQRIVG